MRPKGLEQSGGNDAPKQAPSPAKEGEAVKVDSSDKRSDIKADVEADISTPTNPKSTLSGLKMPDWVSPETQKKVDEIDAQLAANPKNKGPLADAIKFFTMFSGLFSGFKGKFTSGDFMKALDEDERYVDIETSEEEKNKLRNNDQNQKPEYEITPNAEVNSTRHACAILGINSVDDPREIAAKLHHSMEIGKEENTPHYIAGIGWDKLTNMKGGIPVGTVLIASLFDKKDIKSLVENSYQQVYVMTKEGLKGIDPKTGKSRVFELDSEDLPFDGPFALTASFVPNFSESEPEVIKRVETIGVDIGNFRRMSEELSIFISQNYEETPELMRAGSKMLKDLFENLKKINGQYPAVKSSLPEELSAALADTLEDIKANAEKAKTFNSLANDAKPLVIASTEFLKAL